MASAAPSSTTTPLVAGLEPVDLLVPTPEATVADQGAEESDVILFPTEDYAAPAPAQTQDSGASSSSMAFAPESFAPETDGQIAIGIIGDDKMYVDDGTGEDTGVIADDGTVTDDQIIWIDDGWSDDGWVEEDYSSYWSTLVGDVNGDGIEDFLVETYAFTDGVYTDGSYVAFGTAGGGEPTGDMSEIVGGGGFALSAGGQGLWAMAAGDVNGDGLADLVVTTYDEAGNSAFYLVAGSGEPAGGTVDVRDGQAIEVSGLGPDGSFWVSGVGDLNGDGLADLQFDVSSLDAEGEYSFASYVVFGRLGGFDAPVDLAALGVDEGYEIIWEDEWIAIDDEVSIDETYLADTGFKDLPVCELYAREVDILT